MSEPNIEWEGQEKSPAPIQGDPEYPHAPADWSLEAAKQMAQEKGWKPPRTTGTSFGRCRSSAAKTKKSACRSCATLWKNGFISKAV